MAVQKTSTALRYSPEDEVLPTIGDEKLSGEKAEHLVSRHWNLMEFHWHPLSDINIAPATADLQHCHREV